MVIKTTRGYDDGNKENDQSMAVLMQTMAYGPLQLCGTEPMVWAIDGTLAIGYSLKKNLIFIVLSLNAYCEQRRPTLVRCSRLLRGVGGPDISGFSGGSSIGYRPELSQM